MNLKASIAQTLNIMREEVGKVLTSWGFFILTLLTIGFFMLGVFTEYPQRLTTDYGIIKAMIGANASSEAVEFVSRYSVLQLRELLGSELLFGLFSITYMGFGGGIFIIILLTLQTCDNIASDRGQGTLLLYFSKPIRRSKLVLARFTSFAIISFILMFALHAIPLLLFASYILIPNGALSQCFLDLFGLVLGGTLVLTAFLLAVGAMTYLFSSLTDNSLLACLGSLMATLIPTYIGAYTTGIEGSRIDLEGCLFSLYTHVINFLPEKHPSPVPSTWLNFPQPWTAAIILLSSIIVPLLLACIVTEVKEFR